MAETYTVLKDFELEEIGNNEWRLKTFIGFDIPECIELPTEIDGKKIVEIGKKLFFGNKDVKQVKIAEGIRVIGESAFADCKYLHKVVFSEALLDIGKEAFSGCRCLHKLVFPKSIQSIGKGAFNIVTADVRFFFAEDCSITLKNEIAYSGVFYIPASVTVEKLVDNVLFAESLRIYCHAGSSAMAYARKHGIKCEDYDKWIAECREEKAKEVEQKKKEEAAKKFRELPLSERDTIFEGDFPPDQECVVIPARIKTIKKDAFRSRSILKSITFEVGSVLEVIEEGAFADRKMGMEMICIPKSVKKIGKNAFCAGPWLEQEVRVQICFEEGSLLEEIGEGAFRGLSRAKLIGESKYTSPLYELKLPKHIHTIGEGAFESNVGISKVDMSALTELHTIPKNLFHYCFGLKQVLLPPNCEMIQSGAFDGGDFRRVDVPSSCKRIELYAFRDSIKEIVIPESCHFGQHILGKVIRQSITIKPGEERAPKGGFMSKLKNFFGQLKD